jgi:signal transduction histidine kinase
LERLVRDRAAAASDDVGMSDPSTEAVRLNALLDALLFSASHDLRSPLLAISLSAELIERGGEGVEEAKRALHTGAADLERMLSALTMLSRARRRELTIAPTPLGDLLSGQVVISEVPELASLRVAVDAATIAELLATLAEHGPIEVQVGVEGDAVGCDFALRADIDNSDASDVSPLATLVSSLERHAGTAIEALAAHEVVLARQGAALTHVDGRLVVSLPLAD